VGFSFSTYSHYSSITKIWNMLDISSDQNLCVLFPFLHFLCRGFLLVDIFLPSVKRQASFAEEPVLYFRFPFRSCDIHPLYCSRTRRAGMFATGDSVNKQSVFNLPSYGFFKFFVCILSLFCHSVGAIEQHLKYIELTKLDTESKKKMVNCI